MYTLFGQAAAMRSVRRVTINIGQTPSPHRGPALDLRAQILDRMNSTGVWTPNDFLDLGSRTAVDKVLQRLATSNTIRRIDRGLYDVPRVNRLTAKPSNPDYRAVIDAVARRDKARLLVDGITAANQLGLTHAVPAHVTVHTDARLRPIQMDQLRIDFKLTAPSRLYWAGRPAMPIVQALHWLHDMLPSDQGSILKRLKKVLWASDSATAIRQDLQNGLDALPGWMRQLVDGLLLEGDVVDVKNRFDRDKE
jgi:hypothetical protein